MVVFLFYALSTKIVRNGIYKENITMVWKLVLKVMVMVAVMVGVSNYVLYLMTGKSPFSKDDIPTIATPNLQNIVPALPAGKDTVYKWTDADGAIHYSSEPPPESHQASAEKMEVDPNTNLIQGIKVPEPTPETAVSAAPPPQLHSPHSIQGAQKLIEDAKNVQNLLDERFKKQQAAMGD